MKRDVDLTENMVFSAPNFDIGKIIKKRGVFAPWRFDCVENPDNGGLLTGNAIERRYKRIAREESSFMDEKGYFICFACGKRILPWEFHSGYGLCRKCIRRIYNNGSDLDIESDIPFINKMNRRNVQ